MAEYYFLSGDEVRGPFGLADCFLLIDQGTLHRESMICQAGNENWNPLHSLPELNARVARLRYPDERYAVSPALPFAPSTSSVAVHDRVKASGRNAKVLGFFMIIAGIIIGVFGSGGETEHGAAEALAALLFVVGFIVFIAGRFMD